MDDDAWSTVEKTLRKRRQGIAQAWYQAISPSADHTEGTTEVRACLETLLDQAVEFLMDKTPGSNLAEAIGGALAALDTPQPDTLGRSLETLAVEILGGLPAEQAVGLQPRLAKLQGGIATGHGRAARESILSQQKAIHSELLDTREGVERALRTSEAQFGQLIDLLPVGFLAVAPGSGRILMANRVALTTLRSSDPEEVIGKATFDFVRPEQMDLARAYFARLTPDQPASEFSEDVMELQDGSVRHIEFSSRLLHATDEPIVQIVFRDVSDRKRAEAALRDSEQKFRTLAEVTPAGILITDRNGPFYANPGLEILTGYSLEELRHIDWTELVEGETLSQLRSFLDALDDEHPTLPIEFKIRTKSGESKWVTTSWRPIELCGERVWMNTTFDISPRVEIEEKLRAYAKRLELFGEIDRAGILARSKHEIALATLNSISELIGCDRASITEVDAANHSHAVLAVAPQVQTTIAVGRTFRLEHWKAVMDNLKRGIHYVADLDHVHTRTPLQEEIYREGVRSYLSVPLCSQGKIVGVLNLGSFRPDAFSENAQKTASEVARHVAIVLHNAQLFAELESSHQRLEELSRQVVEVQEAERRFLARELHDEIAQTLTALSISLRLAVPVVENQRADRLVEAQRLTEDLSQRIRQLSLDLRPPMLDDLGLLPTLLWYFDRCNQQLRVQVEFEHQGLEQPLDAEIEIVVYRVVQEALTNIARHAGVRAASVRLWANPTTLSVQVEDRGSGFDVGQTLGRQTGGGLTGMRERVRLVGGQLVLDTHPGAGTCLTALLPLGPTRKTKGDRE